MTDYNVGQLKKEQILIVVASTHGEGEPPDDAVDFMSFCLVKYRNWRNLTTQW